LKEICTEYLLAYALKVEVICKRYACPVEECVNARAPRGWHESKKRQELLFGTNMSVEIDSNTFQSDPSNTF
jgi:hypothetical protein